MVRNFSKYLFCEIFPFLTMSFSTARVHLHYHLKDFLTSDIMLQAYFCANILALNNTRFYPCEASLLSPHQFLSKTLPSLSLAKPSSNSAIPLLPYFHYPDFPTFFKPPTKAPFLHKKKNPPQKQPTILTCATVSTPHLTRNILHKKSLRFVSQKNLQHFCTTEKFSDSTKTTNISHESHTSTHKHVVGGTVETRKIYERIKRK